MFKKLNFKDKFNYEFVYPTTHDAVLNICYDQNDKSTKNNHDSQVGTLQRGELYDSPNWINYKCFFFGKPK